MKKYESYKESGIDWVGEIPSHWSIKKIKHSTYVKGRIGWQNLRAEDFRDEGPFLVTGTEFESGLVNWKDCHRVDIERYLMDPFIQLQENDVLITKDGTIGKIAIVKNIPDKATLNTGVFVTRPLNNLYNPEYMFWLLQSDVFKSFIDFNKTGATILHLYQNVFNEFSYPLPSHEEQNSIISFLNVKTGDINQLIQQKETQLEKLQQKRQVIINEAVTKGVNAKVEMKDSGIEWMGQIPKNWEVKKLKYVVENILGGGTPSTENDDFWNGNIPWVSPKDMKFEVITETIDNVNELAISNSSTSLIPSNSVLVVVRSGILKHSLPVAINSIAVTLNQDMKAFVPNQYISAKFLYYLLKGLEKIILTTCTKIGATVDSIETGWLYNLYLPLPNKKEQTTIVNYLQHKEKLIRKSEMLIIQQIEKLTTYRQSLISEVVTGKIKVS